MDLEALDFEHGKAVAWNVNLGAFYFVNWPLLLAYARQLEAEVERLKTSIAENDNWT